ncbi:MAG UNVERIFIED_CONTAM: ABC transporter substrate-binding protein [Rickettsiaceae bacterium]|jgi:phospholipid transport system substrate-binding protein
MVKTHIVKNAGDPIRVDYLVYDNAGNYKVRDIITEGISLVNSQRSEYNDVIENHGIEYLISELKKRSL